MKSNIDFTTGNIEQQIIKFAMPIIAGSLLMQFYNYIDSVIVGRYIGKEALAAVGASMPIIFMIVSLLIGLSIGSTIIIAQNYGRKSYDTIRRASGTLYITLNIGAILLTLLCILFSRHIMVLIRLPESIIPMAVSYLNIYAIGFLPLFIFNSLSAILRGIGDSKLPLKSLAVSAVFNVGFDMLFVIKLGWGIEGAAWATVISQILAMSFALYFSRKKYDFIQTNMFRLTFDKKLFLDSMKLGVPAGLQQLFVSVGIVSVMSFINGFGTDVIAGYSAASRIETIICVFPMNLSMALSSFAAQNLGASKFDRIKQGVRFTMKMSMISSVVIMIVISALALPLMEVFSSEEVVVNVGARYLYVLAISFFIFSLMFTYGGALRGLGNTLYPMIVTLFSLWLIRIPITKILSETDLREMGVWIAAPVSWSIGATLSYLLYKKELRKIIRNSSIS